MTNDNCVLQNQLSAINQAGIVWTPEVEPAQNRAFGKLLCDGQAGPLCEKGTLEGARDLVHERNAQKIVELPRR
jgi:hypothetical protein